MPLQGRSWLFSRLAVIGANLSLQSRTTGKGGRRFQLGGAKPGRFCLGVKTAFADWMQGESSRQPSELRLGGAEKRGSPGRRGRLLRNLFEAEVSRDGLKRLWQILCHEVGFGSVQFEKSLKH